MVFANFKSQTGLAAPYIGPVNACHTEFTAGFISVFSHECFKTLGIQAEIRLRSKKGVQGESRSLPIIWLPSWRVLRGLPLLFR
jgi:hypothetical protein